MWLFRLSYLTLFLVVSASAFLFVVRLLSLFVFLCVIDCWPRVVLDFTALDGLSLHTRDWDMRVTQLKKVKSFDLMHSVLQPTTLFSIQCTLQLLERVASTRMSNHAWS